MRKLVWKNLSRAEQVAALARPAPTRDPELKSKVSAILNDVRKDGDEALVRLTAAIDKVELSKIEATPEERSVVIASDVQAALERAARQISDFHRAQMPKALRMEVSPGIVCERQYRPIQTVGLYIPGGTAPLPSTVMMLGLPAKLAECPQVVLCTPPRKDGSIDPNILAAARICGITRVFKVGGAQAIAAMAYGTKSIPKCDKIFGPGNAWVTEAKTQVARDAAAIDMPAGPSEVMVVADSTANAEFVAWDLLSQAEHGSDSQVVLVTDDPSKLEAVLAEMERALQKLPRRRLAEGALAESRAILVDNLTEAVEVANAYAPEHLIFQVESPERYADRILNAGSVFLGAWTPESVGDYASGTNHVLPTYGWARAVSGLSLDSFFRSMTVQRLTEDGLRDIGPVVETLAGVEGLEAHKQAVSVRLKELGR